MRSVITVRVSSRKADERRGKIDIAFLRFSMERTTPEI
jgi:hypothetical protein